MKVPIAELQAAILAHPDELIQVVDGGGAVIGVYTDPCVPGSVRRMVFVHAQARDLIAAVRTIRAVQRTLGVVPMSPGEALEKVQTRADAEREVDRLLREIDSPQGSLL